MNFRVFFKMLFTLILVLPLVTCTSLSSQDKKVKKPSSKEFNDYWYGGKAELTRYELEQARYGEIHKGDAVLIFVTEDFLSDKQVKFEQGDRTNKVESVLKLNFTKKFFTGLYPYSMMSSIFTPVDIKKPTFKVTTTSQEWCGHTFSQLNLKNNQYKGLLHSYFMNEGDQEFKLDLALIEDEIWTKIRLNPNDLPTGNIQLIPGSMFLRLKHRVYAVENAKATLSTVKNPELSIKPLKKYRVEYQDFKRVLEITFENEFPYAIVAWEEQTESGYGSNARTLTTRAVKTHSINSAYWGKHDVVDSDLRKELGLDLSNY